MSSYKVIQDIEAEDKLIGPLTLRQSIYGGITAVCLYICFLGYSKGATFLIGMFLPIAAITGFFAFPWKGEQPTEIWALARLRFMIKPRVRIWNQSGIKDVVTVLAPKKLESIRPLTNNLNETEVRSRLKALADTIDSRGWATRNASYATYAGQYQSRVTAPGQMMPAANIPVADDIFDASSNVAQNLDAMLARSSQNQRQRVMQQMSQAQTVPNSPVLQAPQYIPPPSQMSQPLYQQPVAPSMAVDFGQYPMQQFVQRGQPMIPQQPILQSPQLPAPVMPALPAPLPSAAPAADYWFANGPAYPGAALGNAVPIEPAGPSAPPTLLQPQPESVNTLPVIPEAYASAIAEGKISADVPIAGSVAPSQDELAFAELSKQQKAAESRNYNHLRVVDPSTGAVLAPAPTGQPGQPASQGPPVSSPSVPGMIDFNRPQPTEDQMQYDTSRPQTAATEPAIRAAQTVTRQPDPAILYLAKNDDLDVATIARQASKVLKKSPGEMGEVEIRLH